MILSYHPIETVERVECVAAPSARRTSCPCCAKVYSGGSIVTLRNLSELRYWMRLGIFKGYMQRAYDVAGQGPIFDWDMMAAYCDHCRHVWFWPQETGKPDPMLRGALVIKTERRVEYFLARHPEAAGVLQC